MSSAVHVSPEEPIIAVGLLQDVRSLSFRLHGDFMDDSGTPFPPGEYRIDCHDGVFRCSGARAVESGRLLLIPRSTEAGRFSLETTIGVEFHWQQKEVQTFSGQLRFLPRPDDRFTVVNDVRLEKYIASVVCSEMSASSPGELIKAHGVVSRSWLLARQRAGRSRESLEGRGKEAEGERIRWYDRESHVDFDVCADDHCQRYHGRDRISSPESHRAIGETRGQVLVFEGEVCDARYGKCCGGVTEDFRTAWSDGEVPYLAPVYDGPKNEMPSPPLTEEAAIREYLRTPPDVYCACTEEGVLDSVLTSTDRGTRDFFRWKTTLRASRAGELIREKLGIHLGRILALEPVERGLSGRLKRLRLVGEAGSMIIGKELEVRRALSPTHLYSSAFVVDFEGPARRPDAFVLSGAGWGHGVGLCQIGAAVMAWQGTGYEDILRHYYPGATLERIYE